MELSELKAILHDVPSHVEVVVGDPDTGVYDEPRMYAPRLLSLWKLVEENPSGGPNFVFYFECKQTVDNIAKTSSLRILELREVECVRI